MIKPSISVRWFYIRLFMLSSTAGLLGLTSLSPGMLPAQAQMQAQATEPADLFSPRAEPNDDMASMEDLVAHIKDDQPPLGSRGDICAINPGVLGATGTVWSDRPLFVWRGQADQLVVRTFDDQAVVWEAAVTGPTYDNQIYQLAYTGTPLPPGQLYIWQVMDEGEVNGEFLFEVMEATGRARIGQDLQQIGATGSAFEQAKYFLESGLWSDAVAVMYTETAPTGQLSPATQDLTGYLCPME